MGLDVFHKPARAPGPAQTPLRAPLRFSELLHLLSAYQSVIYARPLEMGNQEFLVSLIAASRKIAEGLSRAPGGGASGVARVHKLVRSQVPDDAKVLAGRILEEIRPLQASGVREERAPPLYVRGPLPALPRDYARIRILFGPALGLGDQIGFLPLLRALAHHAPDAVITIYTLYPNLWKHLLPGVREIHYRGNPLRPFSELNAAPAQSGGDLVLVADFECFDFHRRVIGRQIGRDVVEIALGRRTAWMNRASSPWMHVEDFSGASPVFNNYLILAKVADRLCPDAAPCLPFQPVRLRRREAAPPRGDRTILLNPFTAKRYEIAPADWHRMLMEIRHHLPGLGRLGLILHPGLNEHSRRYADEIRTLVVSSGLRVRLLGEDGFSTLTAHNGFRALLRAAEEVDLCLTVDTFTGHLSPLMDVPTVVLTDRENREFWVPAPGNFYCLLDRMQSALPKLVGHLLSGEAIQEHSRLAFAARELFAATDAAGSDPTADRIGAIVTALQALLTRLDAAFPYRTQAREWLLLWSRVSAALRREPVTSDGMVPYLFRWRECEFYKLLAFRTAGGR